jgi:hypothetical protein
MQNSPTNKAGLCSTWTVRIALARLWYELHEASDWGSNFYRLVTCVASALLFEDCGEVEAVVLDWTTGEGHNNSLGRHRDGVDLAYASSFNGFNSR